MISIVVYLIFLAVAPFYLPYQRFAFEKIRWFRAYVKKEFGLCIFWTVLTCISAYMATVPPTPNTLGPLLLYILFSLLGLVGLIGLIPTIVCGPPLILFFLPGAILMLWHYVHYLTVSHPAEKHIKPVIRKPELIPLPIKRIADALRRVNIKKIPPAFVSENQRRRVEELEKLLAQERKLMEETIARERRRVRMQGWKGE